MPINFDDRSSGCQEASKTPAQCLYLADPYRLAVLGIKIIAQASIESSIPLTSKSGPRSSAPPASSEAISTSLSFGLASKSAITAAPPPSSFKSPNLRSSSGGSKSGNSTSIGSSRPRSLEIGLRAKEAILDIGRGVNHGWKNLSKSDLHADLNDATTSSTSHLMRSTSKSSTISYTNTTPGSSNIETRRETHARHVYNLRPDSLTFAAGPSAPLASTSIGLQVSSRMEMSKPIASQNVTKLHWENLGFTRTEFVRDAAPSAQGDGRAGVFSAIRRGNLDSSGSEDGNDTEDDDEEEEESEDERDYKEAFDARQLMLKVSPPLQYLRQQDSSLSRWKERSKVVIKARLRLESRQQQQKQHQLSVPSRASPVGPRTPRAKKDELRMTDSQSDIVFVSTQSSRKLYEAVESTRLHRDGSKYIGTLSTCDAARLEGIDWVPVKERHAGSSELINFEWNWQEIGRDSAFQRDVLGESAVKCACAFIELNAELGMARILASFTFLVAIPPAPMPLNRPAVGFESGLLESSSDATLEVKQRRAGARSPHSDGLPKSTSSTTGNRGLGLGLRLSDADLLIPGTSAVEQYGLVTPIASMNSNKSTSRLRRVSGGAKQHSPSSKYRQLSSGSGDTEEEIKSLIVPLLVDHAEINLADVEEDGPILRAAIQNLEKRTVNLKRAAKATLKAAAEVRINLSQLQASEAVLDQCLETIAHLTPSTLGYLDAKFISTKRKEINKTRQEEKLMLQDHVEVPLLTVIDMCKSVQEQSRQFEIESKAYYSATQKWLSSRSTTAASNFANNREAMDLYSPAAIGFIDKASLKQERVDDKQRLRQARFYLARLEVLRAFKSVHGGEAELLLANHVLALCRWHGLDEAKRTAVNNLEQSLEREQTRLEQQTAEICIKYAEMEEMVIELQNMLGKGGDGVEFEGILSSESETAIGSKTRSAGQKIKNILSTLGTTKQSNPPVPNTWTTSSEYVESAFKSSPIKSRSANLPKIGTPLESASALGGGLTSFAKLQQKLRPTSYADSSYDQKHTKERSTSDYRTAMQFPLLDSIPAISPFEGDFQLGGSPIPRRSLSMQAKASPRLKQDSLVSNGDQTSSLVQKYSSQKMGRTSSDAPRPTKIAITNGDQQQNRYSLLQPRRAAQLSRKKEGILWAMSKAIVGAGGADAPKAVSRSQNWKECWVVLSGSGHLGQYAEWKDVKIMEPSQPLIDLRFATVREARGVERRFTFEVVTRESRQFFQASNGDEMKEWIAAISFAIESLLNGTSSIRQIDKVARVAGGLSPFLGNEDEFGTQFRSTPVDLSALGQHRALSQSLTDLSSASSGGAARLFQRGNNNKDEGSRKRDSSKGGAIPSGHLATLSEGARQPVERVDCPITPHRHAPWTAHERGISNKTPVSGYVQESTSSILSQSSWTVEPDYDRKIEEMVHSNYGSSADTHRRSNSLLSGISPVHQSATLAREAALTSSKYSRSKEIIDIAAMPQNSLCADCRAQDPKWASWSLNGEARCIFICITCSGIHRGLGVSISRVKSVELDDWTEEQMESARNWGNDCVNALYEAKKPREVVANGVNGQFWREKYVTRSWYAESHKCAKEIVEEAPVFKQTKNDDIVAISPRSPRWPSSPPVVFISMLDEDLSKAKRRSGSVHSPRTTSDDHTFFENSASMQLHQSPTFKPMQQISKRNLEQSKPTQSPPPPLPPAMHCLPSLAA